MVRPLQLPILQTVTLSLCPQTILPGVCDPGYDPNAYNGALVTVTDSAGVQVTVPVVGGQVTIPNAALGPLNVIVSGGGITTPVTTTVSNVLNSLLQTINVPLPALPLATNIDLQVCIDCSQTGVCQQPLANVQITENGVPIGTTDATGHLNISAIAPLLLILNAIPPCTLPVTSILGTSLNISLALTDAGLTIPAKIFLDCEEYCVGTVLGSVVCVTVPAVDPTAPPVSVKPMPNVPVTLNTLNHTQVASTTTGVDGACSFHNIPIGNYTCEVPNAPYCNGTLSGNSVSENVTVLPGNFSQVNFILRDAADVVVNGSIIAQCTMHMNGELELPIVDGMSPIIENQLCQCNCNNTCFDPCCFGINCTEPRPSSCLPSPNPCSPWYVTPVPLNQSVDSRIIRLPGGRQCCPCDEEIYGGTGQFDDWSNQIDQQIRMLWQGGNQIRFPFFNLTPANLAQQRYVDDCCYRKNRSCICNCSANAGVPEPLNSTLDVNVTLSSNVTLPASGLLVNVISAALAEPIINYTDFNGILHLQGLERLPDYQIAIVLPEGSIVNQTASLFDTRIQTVTQQGNVLILGGINATNFDGTPIEFSIVTESQEICDRLNMTDVVVTSQIVSPVPIQPLISDEVENQNNWQNKQKVTKIDRKSDINSENKKQPTVSIMKKSQNVNNENKKCAMKKNVPNVQVQQKVQKIQWPDQKPEKKSEQKVIKKLQWPDQKPEQKLEQKVIKKLQWPDQKPEHKAVKTQQQWQPLSAEQPQQNNPQKYQPDKNEQLRINREKLRYLHQQQQLAQNLEKEKQENPQTNPQQTQQPQKKIVLRTKNSKFELTNDADLSFMHNKKKEMKTEQYQKKKALIDDDIQMENAKRMIKQEMERHPKDEKMQKKQVKQVKIIK